MLASIIICTHQRAELLRRCLRSIAAQGACLARVEVVVVNNCSTDDTARVCGERDWVKTVDNPVLGLSHSRNAGLAAARGEWVIFLDDDCTVGTSWLAGYLEAMAWRPAAPCLAGRILLDWEGGRPQSWLPRELWYPLGSFDFGDAEQVPYAPGGNMAWRREFLLEAGGFPTNLGRVGRKLLGGEETALVERLHALGMNPQYVPDAIAWHWVPRSHQKLRYHVAIFFYFGVTEAKVHGARGLVFLAKRFARGRAGRIRTAWRRRGTNWTHEFVVLSVEAARLTGLVSAELRQLVLG